MRALPLLVMTVMVVACSGKSNNGHRDGGGGDGSAGGGDGGMGSSTTIPDLNFAIVGDTRPSAETTGSDGYPTAIINGIFQDIAALTPQPAFVVASGDYEFIYPPGGEDSGPGPGYGSGDGCTCNTSVGSDGDPSVQSGECIQDCLYAYARSLYSGPFWPAMGNHECTGADVSNCAYGSGSLNEADFIDLMLEPIGVTVPYYTELVTATDNSWNAKFIFTACNAWDSTQASWLTTQLAISTMYTFVIRHEDSTDVTGGTYPCTASQAPIEGADLTLLIVGHTHEYKHNAEYKEIINGLGGAPLTSGTDYGYTIVSRNADGTLTVTTYDYMGESTIDTFTINAAGGSAT